MIIKVEHLLLFIVIFLMCYNLFSSCGYGKGLADGFSVGGQLDSELDSKTDIKIPLCCHNLWNKLPDDIQKLRGMDTAQECRNEFNNYLLDEKNIDFRTKNKKYMDNFACNPTDIMNYCSYKDDDLYKWKNNINNEDIDINSSNTENSCDFLQFLNNTPMYVSNCSKVYQPGCEYGVDGWEEVKNIWLWHTWSGSDPGPETNKWSTLKPDNPKRANIGSLCWDALGWIFNQPKPDWSNVKNNGFFEIPLLSYEVYCGSKVAPQFKSTYGTNLDDIIV